MGRAKLNKKLKEEIKRIKQFYKEDSTLKSIYHFLTNHPNIVIKKAVICAKKYKFYKKNNHKIKNKLMMIICGIKNNYYSNKYNMELYGEFGENLKIYHKNIVINDKAILGKNIILHGNNCIGNNGKTEKCPVIGDGVDVGYGAVIIGNVEIANNIKIGANSVVTKSFMEEGITIAGVPAKKICTGDKKC